MNQTIAALTSLRDSAAKSLADATCPFQAAGYSVMVDALGDAISRLRSSPRLVIAFPGFGTIGSFDIPSTGCFTVPEATMEDLAAHFRTGYTPTRDDAATYLYFERDLSGKVVTKKADVLPDWAHTYLKDVEVNVTVFPRCKCKLCVANEPR